MILFPCHSFRQAFFWLDNSSNWSLGFLFNRPWLSVRILYGWRKIADHTRRSKRGGMFLRRSYTCHWVLPSGPSPLDWLLTRPVTMTCNSTKYSEAPMEVLSADCGLRTRRWGTSCSAATCLRLSNGSNDHQSVQTAHASISPGSSACFTQKGVLLERIAFGIAHEMVSKMLFFFQLLSSCVTRASQRLA